MRFLQVPLMLLWALLLVSYCRGESFRVSYDEEMTTCAPPSVEPNVEAPPASAIRRTKVRFTELNEWQYRYFKAVKDLGERNPKCDGEDARDSSDMMFTNYSADAFDPLTSDELNRIKDIVNTRFSLESESQEISPTSLKVDWIYALDHYPTNKSEALACLDSGVCQGRYARAVVYHLKDSNPRVMEYRVGPFKANTPIPDNVPIVPGPDGPIDQRMRPVSPGEYAHMEATINKTMRAISSLVLSSYGAVYDDMGMAWTDSGPRGYYRAARQTWIWLLWDAEGLYSHTLGLAMLINHTSLLPADWTVTQLAYNGQGPFPGAAALLAAAACGYVTTDATTGLVTACAECAPAAAAAAGCKTFSRINMTSPRPAAAGEPLFSSMRRRGPVRQREARPPPAVAPPPGGARFGVRGHQIHWLGWDLHIGHTILASIFFNDIRFRGERIVYELSLQDAWASYSGAQPIQANSMYSDGGWGMGRSSFPLVVGVDCPIHAVLMDLEFWDPYSAGPVTMPNAVCVWEQPSDTPLMRHYDHVSIGFPFVSAYARTSLVVRTTSTVYNYDYIYSYIFHMEGSIEVAAAASGYLQADFYPTGADEIANENMMSWRVHDTMVGSIHDHLFHYKVDMDVLGTKNSLVRNSITTKKFKTAWDFGQGPAATFDQQRKVLESTDITNEGINSTITINPARPSHLFFHNTGAPAGGRNKWGQKRSYFIYIPGTGIQLMNDIPWMPSSQWTKYNVAVTQRKDSEPRSCRVLYDMQAPAEPLMMFDDLINGESLVQEDLVAWVMVGHTHIPSAEDVPVTTTPLSRMQFYIRPHNYFDESPASDLSSAVFAQNEGDAVTVTDTVTPPVKERCFDGSFPDGLATGSGPHTALLAV